MLKFLPELSSKKKKKKKKKKKDKKTELHASETYFPCWKSKSYPAKTEQKSSTLVLLNHNQVERKCYFKTKINFNILT